MSVATAVRTVELLRFPERSRRSEQFFEAVSATAERGGYAVTPSDAYHGGSDLLLLWGPGHPSRFEPMRQQIAAGGHVICADLAYWHRDEKVRISIDAAHPQQWVMRQEWPTGRFEIDPVPVGDSWDPHGPVIIAGIGSKAQVQYGAKVAEWEAAVIAHCRRLHRPVLYKPKKADNVAPPDVFVIRGSIEDALRGASLLITWHSNAAVDAIRLGIPVICRDGAAAAVCPSDLAAMESAQPLPVAIRDRFLANLAWFQWGPSESAAMWRWLTELLPC